tara:strand:- start:16171 stop:18462 length:2292 start_codon:yes stop_codon:yes gene_type:complete
MMSAPEVANNSYGSIPDELKAYPQWIVWRYVEKKGQSKPAKIPMDPSTGANLLGFTQGNGWMSFENAVNARHLTAGASGIGFVLSPKDPFVGIDIDNCIEDDGFTLQDWAREHEEDFKSYTEISPSGRGLRIITKGELPIGHRKNAAGREIYSEKRFLTITGNTYGFMNYGIRENQAAVDNYLAAMDAGVDSSTVLTALNSSEEVIPEGQRNNQLTSFAGRFRTLGLAEPELVAALQGVNHNRCNPPLSEAEIQSISKSIGRYDDHQWRTPSPLPSELAPVLKLDPLWLPPSIRPWVMDISERMQCPLDFVAVGCLVALSSVVGRKVCIRPKRNDNWLVVPNLWGLVVGRPGVMKSPALAETLAPLNKLQQQAKNEYDEEYRDYKITTGLFEINKKSNDVKMRKMLKDNPANVQARLQMHEQIVAEEAEPPVLRRYKVTDTTVEALGEILIDNPTGLLVYRDELSGLLKQLDKDGQEGARSFYLQGYDGNQGYTFDRIGRGKNLHIPAVCLAMLGSIQPGKLQSYVYDAVSGNGGDDGLLQRFGLMVWPDVDSEWVDIDRAPNEAAQQQVWDIFGRLDQIPHRGAEDQPKTLQFDAEAQSAFNQWRGELEVELRSGKLDPAEESHLSKYRKLTPALALLDALTENKVVVDKDSLIRAIQLVEYFHSHAKRVYASGANQVVVVADALLKRMKSGDVQDGFSIRDVYIKDWSKLKDKKALAEAVELLCDLGYLKRREIVPSKKGGRPTAVYLLHPVLLFANVETK